MERNGGLHAGVGDRAVLVQRLDRAGLVREKGYIVRELGQ